jgi:hypothetical protein
MRDCCAGVKRVRVRERSYQDGSTIAPPVPQSSRLRRRPGLLQDLGVPNRQPPSSPTTSRRQSNFAITSRTDCLTPTGLLIRLPRGVLLPVRDDCQGQEQNPPAGPCPHETPHSELLHYASPRRSRVAFVVGIFLVVRRGRRDDLEQAWTCEQSKNDNITTIINGKKKKKKKKTEQRRKMKLSINIV